MATEARRNRDVLNGSPVGALSLWRMLLPVAVCFAALSALRDWVATRHEGEHDPFWASFLAFSVLFCYWLLISPLVVRVMHLYPFQRGVRLRNLLIHLLTIITLSTVYLFYLWAANAYIIRFIGPNKSEYMPLSDWFHERAIIAITNAFIHYYVPVAAIGYVSFYRDLMRRRELQAVSLESELSRAKLQLLQTSLQPHFLFNTLNSISELMHSDVNAADRMLTLLSELLRMTLRNADGDEFVPLRIELEHLNKYLQIEQVRFGDRMTIRYEVAPECMDLDVPYLILQPIAENAVKHGVGRRLSGGIIVISAVVEDSGMKLCIEDNGPGLNDSKRPDTGMRIGIRHTEARLNALYGTASSIHMTDSRHGARVEILIPKKAMGETPNGRVLALKP